MKIPGNSNGFQINIYNSFGQMVFTKSIQEDFTQINMSGFSKGVYFVCVQSQEKFFTKRVIK